MIDYAYFEGGLTDTPEVRYSKDGRGVVNFTLAQSDSRKLDNDNWETTAKRYLRVNLWDTDPHKWTDYLANLDKGTKLVVRGKLVTNKWQDKEGNQRSQLEVQAFHAYIDAAAGAGAPQSESPAQSAWGNTGQSGFSNTTPADDNPPF